MPRKKKVLLLSELSNRADLDFVRGVQSFVRMNDWTVELAQYRYSDPVPKHLEGWVGDGIIFQSFFTLNKAKLSDLLSLSSPIVEFHIDPTISDVAIDSAKIGRLAIDCFVRNGISHLAIYTGLDLAWSKEWIKDYKESAQRAGLTCHVAPMAKVTGKIPLPYWSYQNDKKLIGWLKKIPKPLGILAIFDTWGVEVINVCHRLGLRIPDDVSVIAVGNNTYLDEAVTPTLSSIDPGAYQAGYEAASILSRRMERLVQDKKNREKALRGGDLPHNSLPPKAPQRGEQESAIRKVAPGGLVERKSTAMIRTGNADIREAVELIREQAIFGITVEDVVSQLNLSLRTLQRQCRAAIGRSPQEEINRVRLEHGADLLRNTGGSISEVALSSGFSTVGNFIKMFRKNFQTTPYRYRQEHPDRE